MNEPSAGRGGWRIEFGPGGPRRAGGSGGGRGPRGPLRPTGGGGDGGGDDPRGPIHPPQLTRQLKFALLGAFVVLLLFVAIFLRPLLHTPLMWFWRAPLPWFAALLVLGIGRLIGGRGKLTVADLQAGRYPGRGAWAGSLIAAAIVFFVLQAVNPLLVQRSLSKHVVFTPVDGLPETGIVRLVPREVAQQVLTGSFNSSTESLTDLRVVDTPDGLMWSAIRTPEGVVRRYTKKSAGLLLLDAQNTTRTSRQVDQQLKYAPGLAVFDSLTWQLRKKKLLVDLTDPAGILDANGKPLILVPYVKYAGFPVRRPVLGGAFVVHPDGRIEDLSPEESRKRPELVASGRLFPDSLARKQHDSYALRGGIWNFLFLHENQTKITDTELNRQPYLLQGTNGGNTWVSVAEPYGKSSATSAVFLTDSTTGNTQLWKVPASTPLTGNARALKAVGSLTIPGVTFASSGIRTTTSGGFRPIEPRPVFVKGKLYFLVSVIPDSANNVSKTVLIDATTNQSAGIFDTDAAGVAATIDFLKNGPSGDETTGTTDGTTSDQATGTTPDATTPSSGGKQPSTAELRRRLDALLDAQEKSLKALRDLRSELGASTTP